jgi:hypothetical protein
MHNNDEGSLGAKRPANQPGESGSSPTPSLKLYRVHLVPRSEVARFVERWHYSHNMNGVNSEFCFAFKDDRGRAIGAMILGQPAARSVGKYGKKVIEIRRLCCVDDTPKNRSWHRPNQTFFQSQTPTHSPDPLNSLTGS